VRRDTCYSGLTFRVLLSSKIPDMHIEMRNDATTFNVNQPETFPPEKFRLPGVKVWKDSDSVIKDAKDFVHKAIRVTEGSGGAVQTLAPDEGVAPSSAPLSVPSQQPAGQGRTRSCGDEHVSYNLPG
jgi:hypothetical protein